LRKCTFSPQIKWDLEKRRGKETSSTWGDEKNTPNSRTNGGLPLEVVTKFGTPNHGKLGGFSVVSPLVDPVFRTNNSVSQRKKTGVSPSIRTNKMGAMTPNSPEWKKTYRKISIKSPNEKVLTAQGRGASESMQVRGSNRIVAGGNNSGKTKSSTPPPPPEVPVAPKEKVTAPPKTEPTASTTDLGGFKVAAKAHEPKAETEEVGGFKVATKADEPKAETEEVGGFKVATKADEPKAETEEVGGFKVAKQVVAPKVETEDAGGFKVARQVEEPTKVDPAAWNATDARTVEPTAKEAKLVDVKKEADSGKKKDKSTCREQRTKKWLHCTDNVLTNALLCFI
jgi:hypothetical protein